MTEEKKPPEPPPDEDQPKPPVKEPPTEEPPVEEPPPRNRRKSGFSQPEGSSNKGLPSMLLRDHPLLTYQNRSSWPPAWLYCGGFDNTHPQGEVGILKNVFVSSVKPSTRCFLVMEHAGAEYMGDLFISDAAFCMQIYALLL
jgi:hypothetical protein